MRYCALLLPLTLAGGCYDSAEPASLRIAEASLDETFSLHVGERAFVREANLYVRFLEVVADSRCPSSALILCVWQGDGEIAVEVAPVNGDAMTDSLHTVLQPHSMDLGAWVLDFLALAPYPEDVEPIPVEQYVATFELRRP